MAPPLIDSPEELDFPFHLDHVDLESTHEVLFFILGSASFLAFDTVCNAVDIFRDISGLPNVGTLLTRSFNIPCALASIIFLLFRPRNMRITILVSLGFLVLTSFLFTIIVVFSSRPEFTWTPILTGISGFFSAVLYSTTSSFLSQFAISALILSSNGSGCSGVVASAFRIMTKATSPEESPQEMSSVSYFVLIGVIILGIFTYMVCKLRQPCLTEKLLLSPVHRSAPIFSRTAFEIIKVIGG
jgi:4-amino-4-deoxy-L-arabinose transferase-like glycosyltransferase